MPPPSTESGRQVKVKLEKVEMFSMAFLVKPPFRQMWRETILVLKGMLDIAKAGSFWLWMGFKANTTTNRLVHNCMEEKRMLLQYEYEGRLGDLHLETTTDWALCEGGDLIESLQKDFGPPPDLACTGVVVRMYRKPKDNSNLPCLCRLEPVDLV